MREPRARFVAGALPAAGERVRLSKDEAAHARSRRLRAGDLVVLVDGSGREATARLSRVGRDEVDALVERVRTAAETALPIHLLVAGLRAERLAWIAEKATELSASRLTIVRTERTQTFRAPERIRDRLERVIREAAKQCEAARWPSVSGPIGFEDVLREDPSSRRFLLDARGEPIPAALEEGSVCLLVGPEGGWTDAEREEARHHGWKIAALPAGKLRAETAAIGALVLIRAALARRGAGLVAH